MQTKTSSPLSKISANGYQWKLSTIMKIGCFKIIAVISLLVFTIGANAQTPPLPPIICPCGIIVFAPPCPCATYYKDEDGDGFGNPLISLSVLTGSPAPIGYVLNNKDDCNDKDASIYPGAPELCDGKDNNCNGVVDEIDSIIIYVNSNVIGENTGRTWANAFRNLQDALSLAANCSNVTQIWVARGINTPTSNTNRDVSFTMRNNLAIYGGFAGNETLLSQRNWRLNPTILSGDIGVAGNRSDNSYNVISNNQNGLNETAILDGFIIRDGQADKNEFARQRGGGMYNSGSSPLVQNCIFTGNFATIYGGAVYNGGSTAAPTFVNCIFSGNQAQWGGGIYNDNAQTRVINSTISANLASNSGGAMISSGFVTVGATMVNCIVWGNSSGLNNVGTLPPIQVTHSIVQGGYTGTGNLNEDPRFNVQAPIGLGQIGDLRLLFCSPALNSGNNAALPANISTDLAGFSRISGINIDMGAYERSLNISTTIYVDAAATGTNDGSSWANAFTSLQAGLNDMNICSEGASLTVFIAAGTYTFPAGVQANIDNFNGKILGGFPVGGGIRNPAVNPVIIKGNVRVLKNATIDGVRVEQ